MVAAGIANGSNSSSCDFETNWRVAAGSLKRTVVFESSSEDSPLAASSPDFDCDAATPLVLKPEGDYSGPCEIKIQFLQKHEIRQIYVQSTARVYEVYYAQSWQSDNEYLYTVRCSIAERNEQVLQVFDIKESAGSAENSSLELKEEKLVAESSSGTSEDDWVEVKVHDSSLEHQTNSLSNKKSASMQRDIQDLYEATAEISDLDPCASITLRFLSLQNKSCLCVDEVYVFAQPVSEIDPDRQSLDVKGSAGSSLMAMLVPTLLQLSKSGITQIQGQQASSGLQYHSEIETQQEATNSTDLTRHQNEKGSGDQQYVRVQRVDGSTERAETHLCDQFLDGNKSDNLLVKGNSACGRTEEVLEQLVSRVARIEEVCLRLEENMLKPLNSMEMRIHRIEQQLEELVNNSQHTGFPPCLRISAPSFSCNSNSSSFHNDGCDNQPCRASESEKELTSGDLFSTSDDMPSSVNVAHRLPSLVVTAPDFSCEDNLDDDGSELPKCSPQENGKKPLIDDVLAASLSRLLTAPTVNQSEECKRTPFTSHSTGEIISDKVPEESVQALTDGVEITTDINAKEEPSRYTRVLMVMAPEFASEENTNEELLKDPEFALVALPKFTSKIVERSNDVSLVATESGCSTVISDSPDISRDRLVSDEGSSPRTVTCEVFSDADSETTGNVIPGAANVQQNDVSERSNRFSFIVGSLDDKDDEAEDAIRSDVSQPISGPGGHIEPLNSLSSIKDNKFEQLSGHKTGDSHINVSAAEGPENEIFQNLFELSSASLVDFGIPILDVKFTSHEDSRIQLPLEALLDDAVKLNVEADIRLENGVGDAYSQEINLFVDIHEEDETGDSLMSDQGIYDMTLSSKESVVDDSNSTCKEETVTSLI